MYNVIIADDEPLIRDGLLHRNDWNSWGFEVACVFEDGSDILAYLEEHRADVLLTDICMFEVSGLDVAHIISEKYPWMKVILLSGFREFEYAKQALRYNVYDYLLKPIDYDRLKEIFGELKSIFDAANHEKYILHQFGEEEYDQLLKLVKMISRSVLGEGEETWYAYTRMKPMLHNAPNQVREIIVKKLLEFLRSELRDRDGNLAVEFENKLRCLNVNSGAESEKQISTLLCELNDRLIDGGLCKISKEGHDEEILKACKYISNHLSEEITYKKVAEFIHISPRHFLRRFTNEMQESFTDYMIRIRIESAMRLLRESDILPGDIGHMIGYHDEKYFGNLFKKYVGCTIKEYVRHETEKSR